MKILKDIFLVMLYDIKCSKEDFIHAANQESKLNSYFTLMNMICKIIIFTFVVIPGLLFLFIYVLMLVLFSITHYPIIFLPISVIICLPYIVMLFLKKEKGNKNENKN
jgi:hypothetical protein